MFEAVGDHYADGLAEESNLAVLERTVALPESIVGDGLQPQRCEWCVHRQDARCPFRGVCLHRGDSSQTNGGGHENGIVLYLWCRAGPAVELLEAHPALAF